MFINFSVCVTRPLRQLPTVTHLKKLIRENMRSNRSNIKAVRRSCATVISLFICLNNPHKQEMYKLIAQTVQNF